MSADNGQEKMRISFDLDEVLFVNPATHETEKELRFPLNLIYKERLRIGTPELINTLQKMGFVVWVSTLSFRSISYIEKLFKHYGIRFDDIVNGTRHLKEVQRDKKEVLPQKVPSRYRISLHIDDETVICSYGKANGFDTYRLDEQDSEWAGKIIEKAETVRKKWEFQKSKRNI